MNSGRKLIVLASVLVVLLGGAVVMWFKGKPRTPSVNPLASVDLADLRAIVVTGANMTTKLSQKDGKWFLEANIPEEADSTAMERLIAALKSFSIGTLVSEKPANHGKFEVTKEAAPRLQVFVRGKETVPALDIYVGKTATTAPGDSYVRFEGKDQVYIAAGLPSYVFKKTPNDYRNAKIFDADLSKARSVHIAQGKSEWTLINSSGVWVCLEAKKMVDTNHITGLIQKMGTWYAPEFGTGLETPEQYGFEKPFLEIKTQFDSGTSVVLIGNTFKVQSSRDGNFIDTRYVKVEGRQNVPLLPTAVIDDFLKELKNFK